MKSDSTVNGGFESVIQCGELLLQGCENAFGYLKQSGVENQLRWYFAVRSANTKFSYQKWNVLKMRKIVVAALFGVLMQSCAITNTPGFYSGYKKLPASEREKIRFIPAGHPIPKANGRLIYAVNAQSLLNELQHHDTTLVYIWGPHCHGRDCASLQSVQDVCSKHGYRFQAVAEYYADMAQINAQPTLETSLLAINQQFYRTDYCNKYARLFEAELRQGQLLPDSLQSARFYLFKGNKFVRAVNRLKDTQPQFSLIRPLGARNR